MYTCIYVHVYRANKIATTASHDVRTEAHGSRIRGHTSQRRVDLYLVIRREIAVVTIALQVHVHVHAAVILQSTTLAQYVQTQ